MQQSKQSEDQGLLPPSICKLNQSIMWQICVVLERLNKWPVFIVYQVWFKEGKFGRNQHSRMKMTDWMNDWLKPASQSSAHPSLSCWDRAPNRTVEKRSSALFFQRLCWNVTHREDEVKEPQSAATSTGNQYIVLCVRWLEMADKVAKVFSMKSVIWAMYKALYVFYMFRLSDAKIRPFGFSRRLPAQAKQISGGLLSPTVQHHWQTGQRPINDHVCYCILL